MSDELLVKYMLAEASSAEQSAVVRWLGESKEHQRQFDELKLIWDQSRHIAAERTLDENDAWARFKQRSREKHRVIPIHVNTYRWLRIAAIFLMLLGGGWITWVMSDHNNPRIQLVSRPAIKDFTNAKTVQQPTPIAIVTRHFDKQTAKKTKPHLVISNATIQVSVPVRTLIVQSYCLDSKKYHGPKYNSNFDN